MPKKTAKLEKHFYAQEERKMVTDHNIERRCRYRLAKHGLKFHKIQGFTGPVYYIYEDGDDDSVPEDDNRFFTLDNLLDYCERLREDEQ